mmetsp:Transcript_70324/g.131550  ORF Transcript_70324/g.131550 Transcript_70324/m.131550 type:complete len:157 (+) Transcript_70324:77-547(+)
MLSRSAFTRFQPSCVLYVRNFTTMHQSTGPLAGLKVRTAPTVFRMQGAVRACGGVNAGDIEGRVLKAVKKYIAMREEELKTVEEDPTGNKAEVLEALKQEVTATTNFDDLKFDAFDKVEVVLEVEEEFQHIIPDDEADQMGSVPQVIEYIQKHVAA